MPETNQQNLTEPVLDWLESINHLGLNIDYKTLRNILWSAPLEARKTHEFHYFTGLADGLFLCKEIR
ncbi:MAG: hypothetical protein SCI25_03485 [Desulfuromonadales bacterium]|nr:hypothetical protein [Desulfuromonadales bacterium]MDW7757289.1 hypothetical protein [Desulfuromonadales bacterium]